MFNQSDELTITFSCNLNKLYNFFIQKKKKEAKRYTLEPNSILDMVSHPKPSLQIIDYLSSYVFISHKLPLPCAEQGFISNQTIMSGLNFLYFHTYIMLLPLAANEITQLTLLRIIMVHARQPKCTCQIRIFPCPPPLTPYMLQL